MSSARSNPISPDSTKPGLVALVSGGLDSAIMVAQALEAGESVWPLYVHQAFVWEEEELAALQNFLGSLNGGGTLFPLARAILSLPNRTAARWAVDASVKPPDQNSPDEAVYLPGRNLALLTQASLLAHSVHVGRVQLGTLASNPFPDASNTFFTSFEHTFNEAMRVPISIERPLSSMHKSDVLRRGAHFDLSLTLSCLRPKNGVHCGRCNKCAERKKAFQEAGLTDPSRYVGE